LALRKEIVPTPAERPQVSQALGCGEGEQQRESTCLFNASNVAESPALISVGDPHLITGLAASFSSAITTSTIIRSNGRGTGFGVGWGFLSELACRKKKEKKEKKRPSTPPHLTTKGGERANP